MALEGVSSAFYHNLKYLEPKMSQSCRLLTSFGRDLLMKHKPPSAVILLASKILLRHIRRPRPVWRHPYPLSAEWPWDGISWWILDLGYKLFWKYICLRKSLVKNVISDFKMNIGFFYQKNLDLPYICLERGNVKLFLRRIERMVTIIPLRTRSFSHV